MGSSAPAFVWVVTVLGTYCRGGNDTGPGLDLALELQISQHLNTDISGLQARDVAGLKNTASRLPAKTLSKRETQGLQIVFMRVLADAECLGLLPYQLRLAHG